MPDPGLLSNSQVCSSVYFFYWSKIFLIDIEIGPFILHTKTFELLLTVGVFVSSLYYSITHTVKSCTNAFLVNKSNLSSKMYLNLILEFLCLLMYNFLCFILYKSSDISSNILNQFKIWTFETFETVSVMYLKVDHIYLTPTLLPLTVCSAVQARSLIAMWHFRYNKMSV